MKRATVLLPLGFSLLLLVLAHVFAAFWHHLFLGDATLSRMVCVAAIM